MKCVGLFALLLIGSLLALTLAAPTATAELRAEQQLKLRTKLSPSIKFKHAVDDPILNQLDAALEKISTVYMQALFSGTHSPEMDVQMRSMEIELFDLLDSLYKQHRMSDYMKYEGEVTRQMIIYNMLKKLFGYAVEENEEMM